MSNPSLEVRLNMLEPGHDEVRIHFLDHATGSGTIQVLPCVVYGVVLEADDTQIVVECWVCEDEDKDCQDRNNERYAIVRAAITDVAILTPEQV